MKPTPYNIPDAPVVFGARGEYPAKVARELTVLRRHGVSDNIQCLAADAIIASDHQVPLNVGGSILRFKTMRNKPLSSRYPGVTFRPKSNKWQAQLYRGGTYWNGGLHATEELAHQAVEVELERRRLAAES